MKKLLLITILSSLPVLRAMETKTDEEPYQLTAQEQYIESFRNHNLVCLRCPPGGPPRLGVPLTGTEYTEYSDTLLAMSQEDKSWLLQESLKHYHTDPTYWHERYHRAVLIKHGALLLLSEEDQSLLLHNAVSYEDYMFVKFLLQHGINPNKSSSRHSSPLHLVRNTPLAKLLVSYGAKIDIRDSDGKFAFHAAVSSPKTSADLIVYYITQGIAINSVDNYNDTALHYLAQNITSNESDNYNMIQKIYFLLAAGIGLNIKNNNNQTAEDYFRRLLPIIDREKQENPRELNGYNIEENSINWILDAIKEERNERNILAQPWKIFVIGWHDANAVHNCLPTELMYKIYAIFKTSIFKDKMDTWLSHHSS